MFHPSALLLTALLHARSAKLLSSDFRSEKNRRHQEPAEELIAYIDIQRIGGQLSDEVGGERHGRAEDSWLLGEGGHTTNKTDAEPSPENPAKQSGIDGGYE